MPHVISGLANAFLLSVLLVIALDGFARLIGLVDVPSARKRHKGLVPLTGGLAIFAAFVSAAILNDWPLAVPWTFVAGMLGLVAIGVVDDLRDLSAGRKLVAQTVVAAVMVVPGGHLVTQIPDPFGAGAWELGGLAVPFTIIFVVGMINAFNMLDGLDGLAGGAAAAALFWLVVAVGGIGDPDSQAMLLILFATLGFLVFNMPHPWRSGASVFMGDAGSMMLGGAIAYFVIGVSAAGAAVGTANASGISFVALLWLCAVPAIDTVSLMVRRALAGRSPMACDREHLHHILTEIGLSAPQATALIVGISFACGGFGVLGAREGVPDAAMLVGLVALLIAHTLFVVHRDRFRSAGIAPLARAEGTRIRKQGT